MADTIMTGTATGRAMGTVEILEIIMSHLEPLEMIICQRVHPLWRKVQLHESPYLRQQLFLKASTSNELLYWRGATGKQFAKIDILDYEEGFPAFPRICHDVSGNAMQWEKGRSRHWPGKVYRSHPVVDFYLLTESQRKAERDEAFHEWGEEIKTRMIMNARALKTATEGSWLDAYLTQPPCRMNELKIITPINDYYGRPKLAIDHLDPRSDDLATLKLVKGALALYESDMHTKETLGSRPMPGAEVERLFVEYAIDDRSPWVCAARDGVPRAAEAPEQGSLVGL